MKRKCSVFVVLMLFITSGVFATDYIDKSELNKGIIRVEYKKENAKVQVIKGKENYVYDSEGAIPLQLGNGKYMIRVLDYVEGNKYKIVDEKELDLNIKDLNLVYLQSIQNINWDKDMEFIKKAKEITKRAKTDKEKVEIIHDYVTKIEYDKKKAETLEPWYLPKLDEIYKKNKGICYDYASIFAGMTRSVGIPTKLIMGYTEEVDEYHAWNQVYLDGKWITIDTTVDAAYRKAGREITMIKDEKKYEVKKIY